jgi:integrase/recombinase XerD
MTSLRKRMVEELQRRNYSPETIRSYILAVKQFAEYFGKPSDRLGATHVQRFQWYMLQERKLTPGTVEMRMSALRFFFKKMLKRRDMHFDDLPFPKTPRKLPTVLSPEEVRRMIDRTTNLMHRTILMVLYATGVRRTELPSVLTPLTRRIPAASSGLSKPASAAVSQSSNCGEPHIDCARSQIAGFQVNSIAQHDRAIERESRF